MKGQLDISAYLPVIRYLGAIAILLIMAATCRVDAGVMLAFIGGVLLPAGNLLGVASK